MTSLDSARGLILSNVSPVDTERIALMDAGGRVVAEDVVAPGPLPPARIIPVEGSIARADDAALPESPTDLAHTVEPALPDVLTASPDDSMPQDLRLVVPSVAEAGPISVTVDAPGEAITDVEAIVAEGEIVIPRGEPLSPADIRLLAELGIRRVSVHRKPRIAIVSIGDDLAKVDDAISPGKRYDGAAPMIGAWVLERGGVPIHLGPVPRRSEDIEFAISKAFEEDDALVLTAAGGAVKGDDLAQILSKKGIEERFCGIAVSPGAATFFGMARGKPVLLLPSGTADLLVTLELLASPLVQKLAGLAAIEPRRVGALLEQTLRSPARDVCAVWAVELKTDGRPLVARPVPGWPGAVVFKAASVHGLCMSMDGRDIRAGYSVEVLLLRSISRW